MFDCPGDIDVEMPYLDARIFNARAESASYVDDTLSSVRRSVMFCAVIQVITVIQTLTGHEVVMINSLQLSHSHLTYS